MYNSAAELARELKVDRKTVAIWIKKGEIKCSTKHKYAMHYKIPENTIKKLKHKKIIRQKTWTIQEDNLLIIDRISDKRMAELTGRTINSIRIRKTLLRKKGLLLDESKNRFKNK